MGALRSLVPLIILFVVVGAAAFVGYQFYLWTNEMADRGKRTMEKKNVSFSKDGMKVGIKEIKDEDYTDKTQSYFVKAWNYSSFPAYKSRFWNTEAQGSSSRQPSATVRSTSRSTRPSSGNASSSSSALNVPREIRNSQRPASPGGWPGK